MKAGSLVLRLVRRLPGFAVVLAAVPVVPVPTAAPPAPQARPAAPATLAETGLYADFAARVPSAEALEYSPQYPLWSDGAHKRRWIALPPGAAIDAADPAAWDFPVGTRFWKEFALERPIETRYMERLADGSWLFATYLWSADGSSAPLAPGRGKRRAAESSPGVPYDVPGTADCRACHSGHPAGVLGFTALQLSTDRDPAALHADPPAAAGIDLRWLLEHDRLRSLPPELAAAPPRIAASTPRERAVLGYLYANCAGCHNARGPLADLGLSLDIAADGSAELFESALGRTARWRPYGAPESIRVVAGDPEASLLLRRVASRQPLLQMPPLSTHAVDQAAADLIRAWIREELVARAAADPDPRTAAPGAALEQEEP